MTPRAFPVPSEEQRCTAISARRRVREAPGRCKNHRLPGLDVCRFHQSADVHIGLPPDEKRCTGTVKNREGLPERNPAGSRCDLWALKGQKVCALHGGGTPQARRAAAKKIAEAKLTKDANRLLVQLGATSCDNPLAALSARAGIEYATWQALGQVVNDLFERDELRYTDSKGSEQIRSEVAMYERASVRVDTLLGMIAKLNIDDRLVKIEEEKAAIVMNAINAGLAEIGITGTEASTVKRVVARHLQAAA